MCGAYVLVATVEKAKNDFQSTGEGPLNPSVFDNDNFIPSENNALQNVGTPSPEKIVDSEEITWIPQHTALSSERNM